MGIDVSISGVKVGNNAVILSESKIEGDSDITVKFEDSEIAGKLELLKAIDVKNLKAELNHEISIMDKNSYEYQKLFELLCSSNVHSDKKFITGLKGIIKDFSHGFLAEFLSGWLMTKI